MLNKVQRRLCLRRACEYCWALDGRYAPSYRVAFLATSRLMVEALRPISNAIALMLAPLRKRVEMKYRSSRVSW
jgi:hypothetical protein